MAPQVELLTTVGIPVMAHIGFTPQSEHNLGGYRVQGRGETGARLLADAQALEAAGAFAVVMEMVPGDVAAEITKTLTHPDDRHRRRRRLRRARCSSGRTWPGCAPAGWRGSSSSTPTCTACSSRPRRSTPPTSRPARSPAPSTRSDATLSRRPAAARTRARRDDRQHHDGARASREPPAGEHEDRQPEQGHHDAVQHARERDRGVAVEECDDADASDADERTRLHEIVAAHRDLSGRCRERRVSPCTTRGYETFDAAVGYPMRHRRATATRTPTLSN